MNGLLHGYHPLKIRAIDTHDLEIFSAYLQDALLPIVGMEFNKEKGHFSFLANRFCWECCDHYDQHEAHYRVHSAVLFQHVKAVKKHNFHQKGEVRVLNLLTLTLDYREDTQDYALQLFFSGDRQILLVVQDIHVLLKDVDAPWPTQNCPTHIHDHIEKFQQEASQAL